MSPGSKTGMIIIIKICTNIHFQVKEWRAVLEFADMKKNFVGDGYTKDISVEDLEKMSK